MEWSWNGQGKNIVEKQSGKELGGNWREIWKDLENNFEERLRILLSLVKVAYRVESSVESIDACRGSQ